MMLAMKSLSFGLRPKPPFRLDLTAWALRRRGRNIVDLWEATTYQRVLEIGGIPLKVAVRQVGSSEHPRLHVSVTGRQISRDAKNRVASALVRILGLRTDLTDFYALAARDKRLAPLVERFRGVKPPRFPTVFEGLVNAVACQQLSLTVGIELLNRLAIQCSPAIRTDGTTRFAFPRPEDLVRLTAQKFRQLGFSYSKARSLLDLSRSLVAGKIDLEELDAADDAQAIETLMKLRGVGRWTAEYVLLRGFGRTSVFPGDDVGARNRLALWLGRDKPFDDYAGVQRAVRRWQPYAGLVYFHLLLAGLAESGEFVGDERLRLSA
jgi:DNA-3-methyladenine glycosylase II